MSRQVLAAKAPRPWKGETLPLVRRAAKPSAPSRGLPFDREFVTL